MKNFIISFLLLLLLIQIACSMGQRSIAENSYVRDKSKTFYWPSEVKGEFITRTCIKRQFKKCKEWKIRKLIVNRDWDFIKDSKMILINEDLVFGVL